VTSWIPSRDRRRKRTCRRPSSVASTASGRISSTSATDQYEPTRTESSGTRVVYGTSVACPGGTSTTVEGSVSHGALERAVEPGVP